MNKSTAYTLFFILRMIIYAAIMLLINLAFMHDAREITSTGKFGENSLTEILQESLIFILGIIFLASGRLDRELTPVTNLLSVFFFMAFVREFNNQLEFWFYLVLPLILIFAWLVIRDRQKIFPALEKLLKMHVSAYLVTGFLVTFIFSRLFGKTDFWVTLLGEDYNRWAKNAAEEGTELLGYSLFFIAGIEILLHLFKNRKTAAA
ncbi:MAG: hypothetical protein WBK43_10945 [Prolixibacteraceae bacterium]|jgi:hypothetical protein|nr:hypothetical protein [Prolixibacteraceae bacterium]MDI9562602.1 hypothetical protein [Bacteroidota bacterium]NLT00229.1 hypothetical protein [Bacteroidales bacterium]OQB80488.1 MAG: hypothetical protein BWX87_01347 [Bacteroidetes bacterium ADurb.Bin123]HNU78422.1 hypothetical protein [Prolixibacteraceae bacterium]